MKTTHVVAKRGFTLIELLIVVAIIAILAAIAVPNFLEAQVRAKVSRSKADLRTIVTAMEAYQIDNNWIIMDHDDSPATAAANNYHGTLDFLRWSDFNGDEHGPGRLLTSPISYITSVPFDVFNTEAFKRKVAHGFDFDIEEASFFMRGASRRIYNEGPSADDPFFSSFVWPSDDGGGIIYYRYILQSSGPDLEFWSGGPTNYYDPTNGTVSPGDIFYIDTLGFRGGTHN
jgi:prepilin-type N-terminal cleavage/methylation domain-containing protein